MSKPQLPRKLPATPASRPKKPVLLPPHRVVIRPQPGAVIDQAPPPESSRPSDREEAASPRHFDDELDRFNFQCQLAEAGLTMHAYGTSWDEIRKHVLEFTEVPDVMNALKSSRSVVLVPKGVRLIVSDGDSALVLSQILYWFDKGNDGMPRARVKKDGARWLAKTHQDLANETGLTARRVKAVLAKLRKLGFIRSARHKFKGDTMTHLQVRLPAILLALVDAAERRNAGHSSSIERDETEPAG